MDGSHHGDILDNAKAKDTTAAERARRYRARKRDASVTRRDGTVLRQQDGVEFEVSDSGDLTLFQGDDREHHIFIAADYLDAFLERLEEIDMSPQSAAAGADTVTENVTQPLVTLLPEAEEDEAEEDDDSVVIAGQRRVSVYWNVADTITIRCDGLASARDDDLIALAPVEAGAAAQAILQLLDAEECQPVDDAGDA